MHTDGFELWSKCRGRAGPQLPLDAERFEQAEATGVKLLKEPDFIVFFAQLPQKLFVVGKNCAVTAKSKTSAVFHEKRRHSKELQNDLRVRRRRHIEGSGVAPQFTRNTCGNADVGANDLAMP